MHNLGVVYESSVVPKPCGPHDIICHAQCKPSSCFEVRRFPVCVCAVHTTILGTWVSRRAGCDLWRPLQACRASRPVRVIQCRRFATRSLFPWHCHPSLHLVCTCRRRRPVCECHLPHTCPSCHTPTISCGNAAAELSSPLSYSSSQML